MLNALWALVLDSTRTTAERFPEARALLSSYLARHEAEVAEKAAKEIEDKLGEDVRVGRTWIAAWLRARFAKGGE